MSIQYKLNVTNMQTSSFRAFDMHAVGPGGFWSYRPHALSNACFEFVVAHVLHDVHMNWRSVVNSLRAYKEFSHQAFYRLGQCLSTVELLFVQSFVIQFIELLIYAFMQSFMELFIDVVIYYFIFYNQSRKRHDKGFF